MKQKSVTMPTAPKEDPPTTGGIILETATELFAQRGYHATTMREIAAAIPLRAAGIYYWYESKGAILFELQSGFLDELTDVVTSAIKRHDKPASRLAVAVREHVLFHGLHSRAAFVADSELRALSSKDRRTILAKRDAYQQLFVRMIEDGVKAGAFKASDVRIVSYAILLQCTGVAIWFNPVGNRTLDEVADIHIELVLASLFVPRSTIARTIRDANSPGAQTL